MVRATDGDPISVEDFGDPDGMPVLVHHGSPASRRLYRPAAELASQRFGLRLLSYDRPGYGDRPRRRDRKVADSIDDVRRIAEELKIQRLGVWGASGGGSYALACAALLPDLVTGAAVFASFAPYDASGFDFTEGMAPEYASEVDLFFTDRPTARQHWRQDAEQIAESLGAPEGWLARWGEAAGTDAARSWETACHLAAGIRDSLGGGDGGWWDDWVAVLTPWGCDLTAIRTPVSLWHGAHDQAVPVVHGRWLAVHVPGIEAHILADEDHSNVEDDNREAAYAWLRELT